MANTWIPSTWFKVTFVSLIIESLEVTIHNWFLVKWNHHPQKRVTNSQNCQDHVVFFDFPKDFFRASSQGGSHHFHPCSLWVSKWFSNSDHYPHLFLRRQSNQFRADQPMGIQVAEGSHEAVPWKCQRWREEEMCVFTPGGGPWSPNSNSCSHMENRPFTCLWNERRK